MLIELSLSQNFGGSITVLEWNDCEVDGAPIDRSFLEVAVTEGLTVLLDIVDALTCHRATHIDHHCKLRFVGLGFGLRLEQSALEQASYVKDACAFICELILDAASDLIGDFETT